jgi:predicted permease
MGMLLEDLRLGLRVLGRNRGFTGLAVLSLALGIGANTAIFSLVDGMYLKGWPVEDAAQLAFISTTSEHSRGFDTASYPDYADIRGGVEAFSGVAAWGQRGCFLSGEGQGAELAVDVVSGNYFEVLGVRAAAGRLFSGNASEAAVQGHSAVLSYGLWQKRFGGDPGLPGKTILLDGRAFTVLGVAPREFRGLEKTSPTDLWVTPAGWATMVPGAEQEFQSRRGRRLSLVARLQTGVGVSQAQAQMNTLASRLASSYPADDKGIAFRLIPATEQARQGLGAGLFLMAMVGLVLLIACANVANLLLAQGERRRREVAVRLALGAGRSDLFRQLLVESLLLAVAGGALGVALAAWLLKLLPLLASLALIPEATRAVLDFRVLVFTGALSVLAAVLFGLAPGLGCSRGDVVSALKGEEPRLGGQWSRVSFRRLLVGGEIALCVVLLVGSGLLLRSLLYSQRIRPGFDPHRNVLMLTMAPPVLYGYSESRAAALYPALASRLAALPGVLSASYARRPPIAAYEIGETVRVAVPGRELPSGAGPERVRYNIVSPGFFATVGTRILRGRDFSRMDTAGAARVVVINQTMARELWPGAEAVGRHLLLDGKEARVAGVVESGRYVGLHEAAEPYIFFPYAQRFSAETILLVQTAGDADAMVSSVLDAAEGVDRNLPIVDAKTLNEYLATFLAEERAAAQLLAGLSVLGMFLAAVGLYGVIAWLVQRRTREIGIRMALGARPADILGLALGQGIRLGVWGAGIGLVAAFGVGQLLSSRLYGVKATDSVTYVAALGGVLVIAAVASWLPARRAARLQPMIALRHE